MNEVILSDADIVNMLWMTGVAWMQLNNIPSLLRITADSLVASYELQWNTIWVTMLPHCILFKHNHIRFETYFP